MSTAAAKPVVTNATKPANAPKPSNVTKSANTPKPGPEEPASAKPRGETIPLTIYNTFFDVEKVVEDNNLTPAQEELADHLMLHELMADETNPPLITAEVLREVINGCTADDTISLGPNCPNLDKYLGKLSLLVFQTQQGIRGPKPTIKDVDMYGDVTIKISIPIEKLKELLNIIIETPVVETPETEKGVEDLQSELRSLRGLLEQLQDEKEKAATTQKGGGVIEELEAQIRVKLKSLTSRMLDISKKIPKGTPLYTEFDTLLTEFETLIMGEVKKLNIKIDDIPIGDVRKALMASSVAAPQTPAPSKADSLETDKTSALTSITDIVNSVSSVTKENAANVSKLSTTTAKSPVATNAADPIISGTAEATTSISDIVKSVSSVATENVANVSKLSPSSAPVVASSAPASPSDPVDIARVDAITSISAIVTSVEEIAKTANETITTAAKI